ncbi:MAG TPA: site-2 protease family protein [Bacillota bacterium]
MRWSFALFRAAGTTVRIHVTFVLLLAWFGLVFYTRGGLAATVAGLAYMLGLFGSVLLHEYGHALAARRYGIRTPDITLLPIGGVARLERLPDKPGQELVVAAAGPAVNVAIAAGLALLNVAAGRPALGDGPAMLTGALATRLLWANLFLVGFNLLPAFPMDGGRILRAVLAMRHPFVDATRTAALIGQGMAFLLGFAGLLFNPLLAFIALFVYLGASGESSSVQLREATEGVPVRSAMLTDFIPVHPDARLVEVAEHVLRTPQRAFPVMDAGGLVGLLTGEDIIKGLKDNGARARVADVMQSPPDRVTDGIPLSRALEIMQGRQCRPLLVVNEWDQPVGILTCEHVGEFVTVQAALRSGAAPALR